LQNPLIYVGISSPACCVLHGIAFPVVSEWCQVGVLLAELPRFFLS
jgi:hypothetical protein